MGRIERLREALKHGMLGRGTTSDLLDLVEKAQEMSVAIEGEPCTCAIRPEEPCSYCGPIMVFDDAYEKFDGGSDE